MASEKTQLSLDVSFQVSGPFCYPKGQAWLKRLDESQSPPDAGLFAFDLFHESMKV